MSFQWTIPSLMVARPVIFDAIAQAYFDAVEAAGGTLTQSDKIALNNYVCTIRANGTLSKRKLILPFMGGTAASHAIDLITATTKVTWHGTVTHNISGITGDGSTGYGDIAFNPSTDFSGTLVGGGVYLRTSDDNNGKWPFGVEQNSGAGALFLITRLNSGPGTVLTRGCVGDFDAGVQATLNPDAGAYDGWVSINKESNTDLKTIRNGATIASTSSSNTGALTNANVYVCALNLIGTGAFGFCDFGIAMLQFWEGMTATEIIADNNNVEALQDGLNRGVQ